MPRIDPPVEVEVLDGDRWIRGFAEFRQHLPDGWWYNVTVYDPPMHVRGLFARYPDQVRLPAGE